jgi:uncharacterized repeat protein (TIGR01451 family)
MNHNWRIFSVGISVVVVATLLTLASVIIRAAPVASASGEFADSGITLPPVSSSALAWGDYDNDGDLDILISGWISDTSVTEVYRNDGGAVFTPINAGLAGVNPGSVAWGDYDNDGDLDILLAGDTATGITTTLYRNDGNGAFTDIQAGMSAVGASAVAWGDYDNDGDLDILVVGSAEPYPPFCSSSGSWPFNYAKLYRNDGAGVFADTGAPLANVCYGSVAWGDYDNDGDLDILLTGYHFEDNWGSRGPLARIYRNDGNGVWTDTNTPLAPVYDSSAVWGDYDNDGDLDILLAGRSGYGAITKVYRNDGSGLFTDINAGLNNLYGGEAAWGDLDNDGDLDILLTGLNNFNVPTSRAYRNDGNGVFTDIGAGLTDVGYSSAAWGDYDNDGDLDILLSGQTGAGTAVAKVYTNNSPIANTLPSVPTNLLASTNGPTVSLSWAASTDAQTPVNGLSYNLRVGLTPGGTEIMPAMSDLANGYRRIVQLGNSGEGTTAVVRPIPGSTYYWSVQTVDTAFAGSTFSAEGTFSLPTDLRVTVQDVPDPVTVGQPLTYTARVINDGLSTASNVVFTDTLPAGVSLATFSTSQGQCANPQTGIITCTLMTVNPVSAVTVTMIVTPTALTTPLTNTAAIATNVAETTTDNNTVTTLTNVTPFAASGLALLSSPGLGRWGDYDNDGDLDLLFIHQPYWNYNLMRVWRNDGLTGFTDIGAPLPEVYEGNGDWGDYDNDGDLDLILLGIDSTYTYLTKIYRNDGHDTFTDIGAELVGINRGTAAWGDFDNDGDLDLLLTGVDATGSSVAWLYRNDGNDVFTPITTDITGVAVSLAAWGDYDNDGDLDIVVAGCLQICPAQNITRVYRNDGAGQGNQWIFTDIQAGLPGIDGGSLAWGDYDNDGDLDILLSGLAAWDAITRIYRNDGNDTFTDIQAGMVGMSPPGFVAWGDYDNDGDLDVVVPAGPAEVAPFAAVALYRNDGSGAFTLVRTGILGKAFPSWGDYDGDNDLDIVLDGGQVYRNDTPIHNTVPSTPAGLSLAGVDGQTVTFAWSPAVDAQTPASGLSYNLRVGTTPGGSEISAPMADGATGYRRLVSLGNANQGLTATLKLPGPGPFFWSVQAIDSAWAGSPFAPEASFVLTHTVQFSSSDYRSIENESAIPVTVTLNSASLVTVTVVVSTTDGTAKAGIDYVPISETMTFAPGVTLDTFSVPLINDIVDEPDETITLTLSDANHTSLGILNTATLTIVDDDYACFLPLVLR